MGFNLNGLDLKRVFGVVAVLALVGLASCQDEEGLDDEQLKGSATVDSVYSVRIPATIGCFDDGTKGQEYVGDTAMSFNVDTLGLIYLFNETKKAFACSYEADKDTCVPIVLHPSEISGDDFMVSGDVTFYRYVDSCRWEIVRVDDNDYYSLFYGDFHIDPRDLYNDVLFVSDFQSGTWDDVDDYVICESRNFILRKAANKLSYDEGRVGVNYLTSLFSVTVTFTDELGDTISAPQIDGVIVDTSNETHVLYYLPFAEGEDKYIYLYAEMSTIRDSRLFFSFLFHYNELCSPEDDYLLITANDVDNNEYFGVVKLPDEGVQSGAFLNCTAVLMRQDKKVYK